MLALILEQMSALHILTQYVNTEKKSRPSRMPKAFRYPRPKLARQKVAYSTPEQVRSFFGQRREVRSHATRRR